MKSTVRIPRFLPGRLRAPARARLEARSFEALESRFLLSGLLIGPIARAAGLGLPPDVTAQIPAGPRAGLASLGLPAGPSIARDDSYTLASGNGQPTIQVDLIWPEGPAPSGGLLLVSDASGRILYNLPLDGVDEIDAKLPIPSGSGGSSTLEVDLQITEPGPDSPATGSYRVSISWDNSLPKLAAPLSQARIFGSLAFGPVVASDPSEVVAGPPPPRPSIMAIRDLPASFGPTTPAGSTAGDGPGGLGLTGATPASPAPSRGVPSATVPAPASTPPSSLGSTLPSTGLGSPSMGDSAGRSAAVGPLPLSGSSPDGGIFAYPYGPSKGANDPFRATLTIAPAPDVLDDLGALAAAPARRQRFGFALPGPADPAGERPAIARPFDLDLAGSPSATGTAFLPPIVPPLEARGARAGRDAGASRWPILYARIKPRNTLAALFFGSASLFFGLAAPDGVSRLAEWQDDRRWKRRASFGAPKGLPEMA